jgi:CHAT domain-containing protein
MLKLIRLTALVIFCSLISSSLPASVAQSPTTELGAKNLDKNLNTENTVATASNQKFLEQGILLYQSDRFAEASEILQKLSDSKNSSLNQAITLNYLALSYQQLGKLSLANKAIKDSLAMVDNGNSKDSIAVKAQVLNSQGKLELTSGQTEKALESWEKAAIAYGKVGDDAGKIGALLNQSQALQALGLYRRARITLNQVNETLQKQEDSRLKATGLLSLGNSLRIIGDFAQEKDNDNNNNQTNSNSNTTTNNTNEKNKTEEMKIENLGAQEALEQSLKIAEKVAPQLIPEIQLSIGNNLLARKKDEEAIKYYQQAAASPSPITRVQAQLNQLRLAVERREENPSWQTEANRIWQEIEPTLSNLPTSRRSIYAQLNLAQSLSCWKQAEGEKRQEEQNISPNKKKVNENLPCPNPSAEEYEIASRKKDLNSQGVTNSPSWKRIGEITANSVSSARELKDARAETYALGALGGVYEQVQQWPDAQKITEQALKLAEDIQAPDIAYRWQWQLGRILKDKNNPKNNEQQAITQYQNSVDNLKKIRRDIVTINREVQFSFQEGVEPVYRELVALLLNSNPSNDNTNNNTNKLKQAREVIEALQLAELDNFFRRACLDSKAVQIESIDSEAAVIYPVILPDRLEVIVSLPKKAGEKENQLLRPEPVRLSQYQIKETIKEFRATLANRYSRKYIPHSRKLYSWLIGPIEKDLETNNIKNLVFILDGDLRNIPVGALNDGKQFLVEKNYNLVVTPGLYILPSRSVERAQLRTLAAGISESQGPNGEALPEVVGELNSIQKYVPAKVLKNDKFTEKDLKDALKSFPSPIVHLATHGQFSSTAKNTYILTWKNNRVNVDELSALLQNREASSRNAIELLVLSACKTAAGDRRAGLGIAGVALRSGARSTLATLWTVDDKATAGLMGEFYKQLKDTKLNKAEALKNAQLALLNNKNEEYSHPYYWSPYVLVGNWLWK